MGLFSKVHTIHCNVGDDGYDILVGQNILQGLGKYLPAVAKNEQILVVSNPAVMGLYYPHLSASLKRSGYSLIRHIVPDGEQAKTEKEVSRMLHVLVRHGFERQSTIIALGGGVVGDLSGFVASIYMRGINFVNIPTTLLAQVDSAIGGKTGINLKEGKNMVGTFYQPKLVVADVNTLSTLPEEEIMNGLAEVIKYGVICDESFFDYLEKHIGAFYELDLAVIEKIVAKCAKFKVQVVEKDEREAGLRAILNFGHTFGHSLEMLGDFKDISHGMGVALGMQAASGLAHALGAFDADDFERVISLIEKAGLPTSIKEYGFTPEQVLKGMYTDKKVVNKKIRLVLPVEIGSVVVRDDVPEEKIKQACNF